MPNSKRDIQLCLYYFFVNINSIFNKISNNLRLLFDK